MSARTERERDELRLAAIAELLPMIRTCAHAGDAQRPTVYADVTSVARSGMSRTIKFYVIVQNRRGEWELASITHLVSQVTGYRQSDRGVHVGGCGMDMRFHVLDGVAHRLGLGNGNVFDIRSIG